MAFQGVVIDYQEATSCKMASLTKGCSCCFKMALICSCISWAPSCEWICNVLFECLRGYVWLKLYYDLIGYLVVLKVLQQLQIKSSVITQKILTILFWAFMSKNVGYLDGAWVPSCEFWDKWPFPCTFPWFVQVSSTVHCNSHGIRRCCSAALCSYCFHSIKTHLFALKLAKNDWILFHELVDFLIAVVDSGFWYPAVTRHLCLKAFVTHWFI